MMCKRDYLGRRGTGARHGEVPVSDFGLTRLSVRAPTTLRDVGPQIILCTSGQVRVDELDVFAGHAVFVPAGMASTVDGDGLAYVAGVG
jgi:mannose-6-phosphate isomerase class I